MKKITLEINGLTDEQEAKEISAALNNLPGIVAADVVLDEKKVYAYSGEQLFDYSASGAVREAGYHCHVIKEEYITDVADYKESLYPTAAPITSLPNK